MIGRLGISLATGAVVTFILLWIMQILIATGRDALTDSREFNIADFVRVKLVETLETKKPPPKKPPEPEEKPQDMPPPQLDPSDMSGETINFGRVDAGQNIDIGGLGGFQTDGEYLPIVKVAPIYPRRAQSRGLSGHCILSFTVTKLGTVENVSVIECTSSVFERASVNAAGKFKYKPRVVDGDPIDSPGVKHKITFEIEE